MVEYERDDCAPVRIALKGSQNKITSVQHTLIRRNWYDLAHDMLYRHSSEGAMLQLLAKGDVEIRFQTREERPAKHHKDIGDLLALAYAEGCDSILIYDVGFSQWFACIQRGVEGAWERIDSLDLVIKERCGR